LWLHPILRHPAVSGGTYILHLSRRAQQAEVSSNYRPLQTQQNNSVLRWPLQISTWIGQLVEVWGARGRSPTAHAERTELFLVIASCPFYPPSSLLLFMRSSSDSETFYVDCTTQETVFFILAAVRTSNPAYVVWTVEAGYSVYFRVYHREQKCCVFPNELSPS
jgi:hypothetical protein